MESFICTDCGYSFEVEKRKPCPYCGSRKIEREKTAEELIDSIKIE